MKLINVRKDEIISILWPTDICFTSQNKLNKISNIFQNFKLLDVENTCLFLRRYSQNHFKLLNIVNGKLFVNYIFISFYLFIKILEQSQVSYQFGKTIKSKEQNKNRGGLKTWTGRIASREIYLVNRHKRKLLNLDLNPKAVGEMTIGCLEVLRFKV